MKIKCDVIKPDIPTKTGYVYSRMLLQKAIDVFREKLPMYESMEYLPDIGKRGDILNISHKVVDLYMDIEGNIMVDVEPLDTPMGRSLRTVRNSGGELDMEPRMTGTIGSGGIVSDLTIIGVHVRLKLIQEPI